MKLQIIEAVILDDYLSLSLIELCNACDAHEEWILELVDEGIINPLEQEQADINFPGSSLKQALAVKHLQQDLGINLAGAAMVMDLKQEIDLLRSHITVLKCGQKKE